ncbi:heavy-metal-associated domain-containing protein [Pedobacter sp. UC225_65]|uniref:heavy-metal-associated domain-containing protein n=1 Tax=Pedobacter sp. UC225_65 TaxID=3350173 RepID=UPI00366A6B1D
MKTIKISIPDMTSTHCQTRVSNAISKIEGVNLKEVKPATALVEIENSSLQQQVIDFIEDAGYQVAGIETAITDSADEKLLRFKTNINCGGCVAKVTPVLNANPGITAWDVDTTNKDKILSVQSKDISAEDVIEAIQQTGFKIEEV